MAVSSNPADNETAREKQARSGMITHPSQSPSAEPRSADKGEEKEREERGDGVAVSSNPAEVGTARQQRERSSMIAHPSQSSGAEPRSTGRGVERRSIFATQSDGSSSNPAAQHTEGVRHREWILQQQRESKWFGVSEWQSQLFEAKMKVSRLLAGKRDKTAAKDPATGVVVSTPFRPQ